MRSLSQFWDSENYLAETDHQNEIQAVFTNEPQQYGNLISQYRKDGAIWTPSYYQYDALGSTRALTDDAGDTTDTYVYDAWGDEVGVSGTTVNPFRWVGRVGYYWDDETGTFYIRARVYEPVTGRWMSQDPLGFIDGLNLYAAYFVPNGEDPSGLIGDTGGVVTPADVTWCKGRCAKKGQKYWKVTKSVTNLGVCKLYWRKCHCYPKAKPCKPPVGTTAFKIDTGHPHGGADPHTHVYVMNQDPRNGRCFWKRTTIPGNTPPEGAVPFPGPAGGGGLL